MNFAKVFVILNLVYLVASDDLIVQLKNGKVKGRIQTTFSNGSYYAYQGIPFAAPPVGPLRFQAPQPAANWDGILDATKDSNVCYQVKNDSPDENEDCLYISVFTPINKGSGNLPVMFWLYGGAFRGGSANFYGTGPDHFIDQDVIVVVQNYRLGPFGYLSTGDTVVPGNAGLKDQSFALQWTHDNIAAFGGDPNKITIFGESAGSASVGYQILTPRNKGLFVGAIQQSGSPLNDWASIPNPRDYIYSLISLIDPAASVGNSSTELLSYLQSVDAKKIDEASKTTNPRLALPVVEVEHDGAFITQGMYEAYEQGNFNQVPVIIGCNSEEDVFILQSGKNVKDLGRGYDANPLTLIPGRLNTNGDKNAMASEIKSIYLNESETFTDSAAAVVRIQSDSGFTRGAIKEGELISKFSNVYFYIFSYDGELGGWNKSVDGAEKVEHGEDLKYMWTIRGVHSNEDLSVYPESDRTTHKRFIKMWTDFAKYQNPTPSKSELLQNVIWPAVDANNYQYLDIDTDLIVKTTPKVSYPAWKQTYEKYAIKPYITY